MCNEELSFYILSLRTALCGVVWIKSHTGIIDEQDAASLIFSTSFTPQ